MNAIIFSSKFWLSKLFPQFVLITGIHAYTWFELNCCTLCLKGGGRSTALLLVSFHRCETLPCVFSEPRERHHRDLKWLLLLIPGTSQGQFQINWLFQGQSRQAFLSYTTKMGPSLPHPDPYQDFWGCPNESSLVFIFSSISSERIILVGDKDIWKYLISLSDGIKKMEQNEPGSKKPYPLSFALH